jgi:tetratricopeptide (TPR) repeat protein
MGSLGGNLEDEGEALLRANQCDAAIAKFDKALAIDPRSRRSLKGKIIGLRKSGRFEESTALTDEALSNYSRDPYFLVERGWLAFDARRTPTR